MDRLWDRLQELWVKNLGKKHYLRLMQTGWGCADQIGVRQLLKALSSLAFAVALNLWGLAADLVPCLRKQPCQKTMVQTLAVGAFVLEPSDGG